VPERLQTKRGTPAITYWLCVGDTHTLTPFQGFPGSLIQLTPVLKFITTLPSSVFELYVDKEQAAFARIHGVSNYRVVILPSTKFDKLRAFPANPFNVFLSDAQTVDAIEAYCCSIPFPLLHLTTAERPGIRKFETLCREDLQKLFRSVLSFFERSDAPKMILLPEPDTKLVTWDLQKLELRELNHGVTIPNELALESLRFQLTDSAPLPAVISGTDVQLAAAPIVAALSESVKAVRAEKDRIMAQRNGPPVGPTIDTIVWAAAVLSDLPESIPDDHGPEGFGMLLRALIRQRDYLGLTNQTAESLGKMLGSRKGMAALASRKDELELCTAALGLMAAGNFAPVIRVRPAVNLVKGRLRQIAQCATGSGPRKGFKLSKLAHGVGDALCNEIGHECMKLIEQSGETIKLVSNAPLELLPVRKLPLQLRFTTSRLPVTPGSVFLNHVVGAPSFYLSPSDLKNILIIRSFEDNDPIKQMLKVGSDFILEGSHDKLSVEIVDVCSSSEFVDALNSFSGRIVIFDGHGSQSEKGTVGLLRLGAHDVHPLELVGKIQRMPPIVILSACSMHPIDWTEDSSATGFLMLGAISVLATITPILAREAAVFASRLLLRIAEFVPLVAGTGQRWSDIVTGLLRMSYVTDLIRSLETLGLLNEEAYRAIQIEANTNIGLRKKDWFETVLNSISTRTGIPLSDVETYWYQNSYFTNTLQYVHLGSPERIAIVEDDNKRRN
jgi:hypothetical protein